MKYALIKTKDLKVVNRAGQAVAVIDIVAVGGEAPGLCLYGSPTKDSNYVYNYLSTEYNWTIYNTIEELIERHFVDLL